MKKALSALTIVAAFSLAIFSGCSSDTATPVSAPSKDATPNFVKLPERLDKALAKQVTATQFITRAQGGELRLYTSYRAAPDSHLVEIDIKLKIGPQDLPYDASLTMTLDDVLFLTEVNLTFGPHGVNFNKRVKLEVKAKGLTLAGATDHMRLYYIEEESWIEMPHSDVHYRRDHGDLDAKGELPHFSQYAFGRVDD